MSNDLKATAYHEAGRAVIAYLHGRRFRCVSIQPSEDCNGFIEYYDARIIGEILGGTHCSLWLLEHPDEEMLIVERSILSAMAGHIAQEIGSPGSVEPGQMESDRELLAELLLSCNPESGWNEAEEAVGRELKDNWYLVDGLAKLLIERETITGKEARTALGALKEAYLACIPQLGI